MTSRATSSRRLPAATTALLGAALLAFGVTGCGPGANGANGVAAKDAGISFGSLPDSSFQSVFLTDHDVLSTVGGLSNFSTPNRFTPATSFPSLPPKGSLSQGCYDVLYTSADYQSKLPYSNRSFIQTAATTTGESAAWIVAEYGSADDIAKIVQADTDRVGKCDQVHRFEAGDGALYAWSADHLGSSKGGRAFVRISRGDVTELFNTTADTEALAQDQVKKLLPLMVKRLESLPAGK